MDGKAKTVLVVAPAFDHGSSRIPPPCGSAPSAGTCVAQDALRKVVKGVGGFDHATWRSFSSERVTNGECRGFIDGDLIEQFLDLKRGAMERVAQAMGPDACVEELSRVVEDLSRLH